MAQLLTRKEAAAELRIGLTTLAKLLREKEITCVRVGRKVLFTPDHLRRFTEKQTDACRRGKA